MAAHKLFIVLSLIAYIVSFTLTVYAIKSGEATPMLVALVFSVFFSLMIPLTK